MRVRRYFTRMGEPTTITSRAACDDDGIARIINEATRAAHLSSLPQQCLPNGFISMNSLSIMHILAEYIIYQSTVTTGAAPGRRRPKGESYARGYACRQFDDSRTA